MSARLAHARPLSLSRLLDPAVHADPYGFYRELREAGAVRWDPYFHTWLVTGYAEAVQVFQEFLSARTPSPAKLREMGLPMLASAADMLARMMMFMDGPAHARVRGACSATFTPKRIRALRERMERMCAELLAPLRDGREWNLLSDFAEPLPAMITTDLLGLPVEDWRQLKSWSDAASDLIGNFHQSTDEARRIEAAIDAIAHYASREIALQRRNPSDGLIGALVSAEGGDGSLSDDEIIANVVISLVGGLGSTTHLINSGLATLIAHPGTIAAIRRDPEMMASAIEELLRFESPSQFSGRIAPADYELAGCRIAKGDAVMVMTAAANRDPAIFADPDRLDLRRTPNRHLAFAWGPHFCIGATLARLACRVAFEALFARVDDLHLARPLVWRENLSLRGLQALWVVPSLRRRTGTLSIVTPDPAPPAQVVTERAV